VLAGAPAAQAQRRAVQDTTLWEESFPGPPNHTLMVRTVVPRGGQIAPHTHPGVEMAYVVSGVAELRMAGQATRTLRPGGSFAPPPGTPHEVRNVGQSPLTIVSTYVVDRSRPLASPARLP
jgi:quercetin dioxygenase-like cupin family protein